MAPVSLGSIILGVGTNLWQDYTPFPYIPARRYLCAGVINISLPDSILGYVLVRARLEPTAGANAHLVQSWKFYHSTLPQVFLLDIPLLYTNPGQIVFEARRILFNNMSTAAHPLTFTLFYEDALIVNLGIPYGIP